jgi:hypothetical protein
MARSVVGRDLVMDEFEVAERVVRRGSLPPWPEALARGQSWPVAWHHDDRVGAVLFVQHSAHVSRWLRPRFDLLIAELTAEDDGPFLCDSVGGIGPGPPDDPFGPPPVVTDGLVEAGTAERVTSSDDGELPTHHAVGYGRAGSGIAAVELRTDLASVRVPVVATGGYFVLVAIGSDPELVAHGTSDEGGTAP